MLTRINKWFILNGWTKVVIKEITVEQYLLLLEDYEDGIKNIFWKMAEFITEKQFNEILSDLMGVNTTLDIIPKKKKDSEKERKKILENFHINEGFIMFHLHQQRSEVRGWTIEYFNKVMEDLPVILGHEKLEDWRSRNTPDKKWIKNLSNNQ